MTLLARIRGQASDFLAPLLASARRILLVEPLGIPVKPGVASLTNADPNVEIILEADTTRLSMRAVGGAVAYVVGTGTQSATANSHYLADGERLDIACDPGSHIAFTRATGNTANTSVYITELE